MIARINAWRRWLYAQRYAAMAARRGWVATPEEWFLRLRGGSR